MVYTSSSIALAVLENLVHFDPFDPPDGDSFLYSVDIPDSLGVETVDVSLLHSDWDVFPGPDSIQEMGSEWVTSGRTAVLQVPSAIVKESNFLLNPVHPDFPQITIGAPAIFSYDPRLIPPD